MPNTKHRNLQDKLNRCMPIAYDVKLGDLLQGLVTAHNDLETKYNSLLAKLDADATAQNAAVASSQLDTDYEATLAAANAQANINDR